MRGRLLLLVSLAAGLWLGCGSGDRRVGAACWQKEDCASGLCLQERRYGENTGWPDGYCTSICSERCGDGESCLALEDLAYCMAVCQSNSDCRTGYLCDPWALVCLPDCRNGWSCGTALLCNADGFCAEPGAEYPVTDDAGTEDAGTDDAVIADAGPDDGSSAGPQDAGAACGGCPAGYVCNGQSSDCVRDCRAGYACPEGYSCNIRGLCVQGSGGPGDAQGGGSP